MFVNKISPSFAMNAHPSSSPPIGDANMTTGEEARVKRRLADAIFEHRLPPGTKLAEADLCRILGTSRGTVRKVLDRLAGEELVEQIANRGAFVARPSVEATRNVYALRRILEAGVVRTLVSCGDCQPWINAVRLQVSEEREANKAGDTGRYIRLAGKFHLDLAAATRNTALNQHLRRVVAQTSLMTALYDEPGTNTCSVQEHLDILDAIEAGRHTDAERLMEEHLTGCERQLRLDREPKAVDLATALMPPALVINAMTAERTRTATTAGTSVAKPGIKATARGAPKTIRISQAAA